VIERFNLKRVSRAYFVEHLCAPYRAPRSPNAPPTGARAPLNVPVPDFLFRTAPDLFCSIYIVRRKWCMLTAASAASRVLLVGAAAPQATREMLLPDSWWGDNAPGSRHPRVPRLCDLLVGNAAASGSA
jgi:hypothetical protein